MSEPLIRAVDCVQVPVRDLDSHDEPPTTQSRANPMTCRLTLSG